MAFLGNPPQASVKCSSYLGLLARKTRRKPMSEENLKLVQSVYAAFGRGDIPAVLEIMTPDATIGIVGRRQDAPFLGIFEGKAGGAEFFTQLAEAQEFHTFEP